MSEEYKNPYLICELANSHGGSKSELLNLIESFSKIQYPKKGIKFQIFKAETIALPDFSWYPVYKKLEFDELDWYELIDKAAQVGDVWIDIFDIYSIQVIKNNIQKITGVKLQASILQNQEVLNELKNINLSELVILINVSGYELAEIRNVIQLFIAFSKKIVIQFGFQAYPTKIIDTALQKLKLLKNEFPNHQISIADHADGISDFAKSVPIYATLLGCSYIEKHFCSDRSKVEYDGYSALEFDELQSICDKLTELSNAFTDEFIIPEERKYLDNTIQIPVLNKEKKIGSLIHLNDLIFRRTSQKGITWPQIEKLQSSGNILINDVEKHKTVNVSDFKKAKIAAIVACRMKSSRLSQKAILPINGIPSVETCLNQCFNIQSVDQVILATSTLEEDQILKNYLCNGKADFWSGDPQDVLSRYLGACYQNNIDIILRITADCPFVSVEIMNFLLKKHLDSGADYTAANNVAVGTAGEIINTEALQRVIDLKGQAKYSEYMTWYFRNNPEYFNLNIVELPSEMVRDYRLTLDYQEDLELFEEITNRINSSKNYYKLDEVFKILDGNPDLVKINSHIKLKYREDKNLIKKLDKETKI